MTSALALVEDARAVIFDLDGTLVDTFDDLALALDEALRQFGLPPAPRDALRHGIHRGLDDTARGMLRLLGAAPPLETELVCAYRAQYRARAHAASRPYAGVREFLDDCRRRARALAVCTNKPVADARDLLARIGLADFFTEVIGIDACGAAKPDPAPLRLALARLGCPPGATVFIGDSEIDAQCAKNAAVPFLLHEAGFGPEAALAVGCDGRFRSFLDLLP